METSTLVDALTKHKELFGIATGSLGIVKTLWSFADARSRESRRDVLLRQVRVLGLAVRELRDENILTIEHSNTAKHELELEVSRTLGDLVTILQGLRENRAEREGLGLLQRIFLLYKPPNWRAWIAQVLCWLSAVTFVFYMFGISVSNKTGDFSFAAFKQAWSDSATYAGLFFVLGIFLLTRLWARLEHKAASENITLQRLRENRAEREGLRLVQRIFLLYKPPSWRAWIAQVLCWLSAITFVFYMLGVSVSDETGDFSFAAFKQAWSDSRTYAGLFFMLGIFLVTRLWARLEHKAVSENITSGVLAIGKALAWAYGVGGLALTIFGVTVGMNDLRSGLKWVALGVVTMLCGVPLNVWAKARQGKPPGETWKAKVALFAPSVSLAVVVVLNLGGVVLAPFDGDIVGYWRSWIHEPVLPLVILPIAVIPLLASFRALKHSDIHVLTPPSPSP